MASQLIRATKLGTPAFRVRQAERSQPQDKRQSLELPQRIRNSFQQKLKCSVKCRDQVSRSVISAVQSGQRLPLEELWWNGVAQGPMTDDNVGHLVWENDYGARQRRGHKKRLNSPPGGGVQRVTQLFVLGSAGVHVPGGQSDWDKGPSDGLPDTLDSS